MEGNALTRFPPQKIVNLCRILNNEMCAKVKIGKYLSLEFKVNEGLRQGDAIVPLMFNVVLDTAIRRSEVETRGNIFDKCSQITAYDDSGYYGTKITRF